MPLFLFIFHILYIHTFIHSHSYNTFIHRHSLGPLPISSSLVSSVGKTTLWCRAENRTRACLSASRRATNWATAHHIEPRRTRLSHAALCWATPHHSEPRRTILSHAARGSSILVVVGAVRTFGVWAPIARYCAYITYRIDYLLTMGLDTVFLCCRVLSWRRSLKS